MTRKVFEAARVSSVLRSLYGRSGWEMLATQAERKAKRRNQFSMDQRS